jgi:hypothetical protein
MRVENIRTHFFLSVEFLDFSELPRNRGTEEKNRV